MSDTTCILAHDVGTSGTKSSLMLADGTIAASQTTTHDTSFPQSGWAEQNPEDWWRGICANTRALTESNPALCRDIAGIGVSGHMLGCLPIAADGTPLRPIMIHSDCRATAAFEMIRDRIGADTMYEKTGNILDPRSPICKLLWLKQNEPDTYAQTARFLQSKDYIVYRLTGCMDSTDFSDASHAQLIDVRRKTYLADIFAELDLDVAKQPALHAGSDIVGTLSKSAADELGITAGIPVVAGGGDGACATVGAGVVTPGDAYCCLGTTAWVAGTAPEPFIDPKRRTFNLLNTDGETCSIFGTVQSAGSSVKWVMNLFDEEDYTRFSSAVDSVPVGADGLIYLPYLEGERSPIWDANARGVFFGLNPSHDRPHFYRAVLEGVSYALRSIVEIFRETGDLTELRAIGGGAKSNVWRQILADAAGVTVQTLSVPAEDATSLGAAITAGVGVGLFDDFPSAAERIQATSVTEPDPAQKAGYDRAYALYQSLYPNLKESFSKL